eukprot:2567265-Pleurochrysis_carterae.AAC.1
MKYVDLGSSVRISVAEAVSSFLHVVRFDCRWPVCSFKSRQYQYALAAVGALRRKGSGRRNSQMA